MMNFFKLNTFCLKGNEEWEIVVRVIFKILSLESFLRPFNYKQNRTYKNRKKKERKRNTLFSKKYIHFEILIKMDPK